MRENKMLGNVSREVDRESDGHYETDHGNKVEVDGKDGHAAEYAQVNRDNSHAD